MSYRIIDGKVNNLSELEGDIFKFCSMYKKSRHLYKPPTRMKQQGNEIGNVSEGCAALISVWERPRDSAWNEKSGRDPKLMNAEQIHSLRNWKDVTRRQWYAALYNFIKSLIHYTCPTHARVNALTRISSVPASVPSVHIRASIRAIRARQWSSVQSVHQSVRSVRIRAMIRAFIGALRACQCTLDN